MGCLSMDLLLITSLDTELFNLGTHVFPFGELLLTLFDGLYSTTLFVIILSECLYSDIRPSGQVLLFYFLSYFLNFCHFVLLSSSFSMFFSGPLLAFLL